MKSILLLALLVSCSQAPKKTAAPVILPVNVSEAELLACGEYQKNVLDKAYTEENGKHLFTKDVKEARKALSSFNVEKGLLQPKSALTSNVLQHCDEKAIKDYDLASKRLNRCNLIISELNFFQALAGALKTYPWPTDLKLEGKKVALDYVASFAEGPHPLLNRLVALSVLDELAMNKIVNEDLHSEIKQEMNASQKFVEGLRTRVSKDPTLTCDALNIIRDELEYSEKVGQKIKNLLLKI